jgi:hypothetical protein
LVTPAAVLFGAVANSGRDLDIAQLTLMIQSSTEFMELLKRSAYMAQHATDPHIKAQYEKLAVEWAKAAYEKAIADQKDK